MEILKKLPSLVWNATCSALLVKEFLKAKCLMNCEVALILERKVFEKSLQYVKHFSRHKNPDVVRQVQEVLNFAIRSTERVLLGSEYVWRRGRKHRRAQN
ncbi:HRDC-like [Trema orientale]|uniref:HRDC-like n=1 Tax=Trema orientale TaxID=63057 RepID=A0A2P5EJG3_TREOI|nr:HRDC-like [Trema orientale]